MKSFDGIICALVTPLNKDETIDVEAVKRVVDHVDAGGTNAFLALGSTGEQIALTREAKKQLIKTVYEAKPVDKPMMVGCGASSTKLAIQNCHDAEELGADAIAVTPPCFYLFDEDGVVKYFTEIAAESSVPVYLYNISRFTKIKLTADTVRRLVDNPKICGIKESDRDEELVRELVALSRHRDDFAVIQGSDRIFLKSFRWGCKAGVTVVGNIFAGIAPSLYRAFKDGNIEKAEELQSVLLESVRVITLLGKYPQELKAMMSFEGLCEPNMTSPYIPLTDEMLAGLRCEYERFCSEYKNLM